MTRVAEAVALMLEVAMDGVYTMRFPQIAESPTRPSTPRSSWMTHH